jgi:proline iminopeptidase
MHVTVNGVRLFFDVEGAKRVPDGAAMAERPTLILLHGGPGADHSLYKPEFSTLSEVAQVIYLDHRANGLSESGPVESWTLSQWADDLNGFCQTLGIEKPVILGTSFGGFVALAYATRYPDALSKLILISTAARFDFAEVFAAFERRGGPEARTIAEAYWSAPSTETRDRYIKTCLPLYTVSEMEPDWLSRAIRRDDVAIHFNGPNNEQGRMDYRAGLARLTCPVLVMAGEQDPITPMAFSEEIVTGLTRADVTFERFEDAGHGIVGDAPERALHLIRNFVAS